MECRRAAVFVPPLDGVEIDVCNHEMCLGATGSIWHTNREIVGLGSYIQVGASWTMRTSAWPSAQSPSRAVGECPRQVSRRPAKPRFRGLCRKAAGGPRSQAIHSVS